MTTAVRPARTFRFPRHKQGSFAFRRHSATELAIGLLGSAVAITMLLVAPMALKALGAAFCAVCWLAGFAPYRGRTYVAWWEISRAHKRLLRTGRAEWKSAAPTRGMLFDGTPLEVDPPPGIGRLTWFTCPSSRGDLAVVLQHDLRVLSAALEVERESVFAAQDQDDQEQTLRLFQDLLDGLGNGRTASAGWPGTPGSSRATPRPTCAMLSAATIRKHRQGCSTPTGALLPPSRAALRSTSCGASHPSMSRPSF